MGDKKRVLFLCTHNASRSQMAEGLLNSVYGDRYEAYSAGTEPSRISPYAVDVMQEVGVDISANRSKNVSEFLDKEFDYVVTLCDSAADSCPFFPGGGKYIHRSFSDPSSFRGSRTVILAGVRKIRDEIRKWIKEEFG
jgi:arsenate reductase